MLYVSWNLKQHLSSGTEIFDQTTILWSCTCLAVQIRNNVSAKTCIVHYIQNEIGDENDSWQCYKIMKPRKRTGCWHSFTFKATGHVLFEAIRVQACSSEHKHKQTWSNSHTSFNVLWCNKLLFKIRKFKMYDGIHQIKSKKTNMTDKCKGLLWPWK